MYKCAVIVTTHNRSNELKISLDSLANQNVDWGFYQIIVVDNYSDDQGVATKNVCEELIKSYPRLNLEYHYESIVGGITYSRNKWARNADAEIIIFGDDDYIAEKSLVGSCYKSFEDKSVAIVVGPLLPKYEAAPPIWVKKLWQKCPYGKYLSDFTLLDFGAKEKVIPYQYAFWSNQAIKKSFLLKSNGYGPDGFGGDKVAYNGNGEHNLNRFAEENGFKIVYCPSMLAYHRIFSYRFTRGYFRSRYFYYGVGASFDASRKFSGPLSYLYITKYIVRHLFNRSLITNCAVLRFSSFWSLQGFLYHQFLLRNNPILLDFILRDSWFDYDFSKLTPLGKKPSLW